MSQLGCEPIFDSYLAVVVLGAALIGLLWLKPQFGSLGRRRQFVLTALRVVIVLLAILALLRPTWITTVRTPRPSSLLVLLDGSRSMQLPSGRSEQSRWQAQTAALASVQIELARLATKAEIRAFAYDQKLQPLEVSAGKIKLADAPTGEQTDIGTTLAEALQAVQGKPVVGVLLLATVTAAVSGRAGMPRASRSAAAAR